MARRLLPARSFNASAAVSAGGSEFIHLGPLPIRREVQRLTVKIVSAGNFLVFCAPVWVNSDSKQLSDCQAGRPIIDSDNNTNHNMNAITVGPESAGQMTLEFPVHVRVTSENRYILVALQDVSSGVAFTALLSVWMR